MGYHLNKLKMAMGGAVKGYKLGGSPDMNELANSYGLDGLQIAKTDTIDNPFNVEPYRLKEAPRAPEVFKPEEVSLPPVEVMDTRDKDVGSLFEKYYKQPESIYAKELAEARARARQESDKFNQMLSGLMSKESEKPSKAELYFRLMGAFGEPTKTGAFTEHLGKAGTVAGEYVKETRQAKEADRRLQSQLGLEVQKLNVQGAKDDVSNLRSLTAEEMKDRRTMASDLMKEYIKSGQAESSAGKQAKDEGLKVGTPEYQKRVKEIADTNIEKTLAGINSNLANVSLAQANLALSKEKFGLQKEQAAKLSPQEVKLKTDTEELVAQTDQALENLKKAYSLNPNTFDASLVDVAQRKLLEAAGSKDPKVQNTREMENLLEKAALSSLKSTFPGAISNDERKALMDVQGLGAKSKEERARIMKNGYAALKSVAERARKRLNDIKSGVYRNAGGIDEGVE